MALSKYLLEDSDWEKQRNNKFLMKKKHCILRLHISSQLTRGKTYNLT